MSSRDWVYERFSEFYKSPRYEFPSPASFSQREYGFLLFKERAMVRHKGFASSTALRSFVRQRIPSDVYHSCAYYENPEAEMDKKGWAGADLVFDIDADHIPTSCGKIHDEWKCSNPDCGVSGGMVGRGITPDMCPACGGVKFETKTWACEQCIDTTRVETRNLLDMLMADFGFSEHEIRTFFSGHRGYHIHVESEAVRSLDAVARKEIVDYVTGIGIDLFEEKKRAPHRSRQKKASTPTFSLGDYGWKRRLKRGMRSFLQTASKEDLKAIGIKQGGASAIVKNKETILNRCIDENRWNIVRGVGYETWMRIAEHVKNREISQIDTVVTSDVHRLIRANGTLHGKTGLLKVEFPVKELDTFDPFVGAVAFKGGNTRVSIWDAPEFKLSGETFGPYKNQQVTLPTAAAVLLILKGRAELAEVQS
ncbi:MAG: DNA primase small subunit PriS [Candidatus Bathyarchaeota archaeon]|nr:DNA primase small subunit PriS [Candidatus Bathyarchaeota archaeon]